MATRSPDVAFRDGNMVVRSGKVAVRSRNVVVRSREAADRSRSVAVYAATTAAADAAVEALETIYFSAFGQDANAVAIWNNAKRVGPSSAGVRMPRARRR